MKAALLALAVSMPAAAQAPRFVPDVVCPEDRAFCIVNRETLRELSQTLKRVTQPCKTDA